MTQRQPLGDAGNAGGVLHESGGGVCTSSRMAAWVLPPSAPWSSELWSKRYVIVHHCRYKSFVDLSRMSSRPLQDVGLGVVHCRSEIGSTSNLVKHGV